MLPVEVSLNVMDTNPDSFVYRFSRGSAGDLIRSTTCGVGSLFTHNRSLSYTAPAETKFLSSIWLRCPYLCEPNSKAANLIFYSAFEPIYLLLPLIGFIIGMFGAMLGGGGGFFFLPVLTLIVGAPPHLAVATSLAATLPICIVGSLGHYRKGNIDVKTGALFVGAGIVGAFAGAAITGLLSPEQLKVSFGIYAVLIALNMSYSTWKKKRAEANGVEQKDAKQVLKITKGSFFGLSAGLIAGTFGTSGTAAVIAGLFAMRLPVKMVVGTSLLVVLVNTFFAVGAHFLVGQIDLTLVWFLTGGSVIGAIAGTKLLSRANVERSENNIRYLYALVMIAIGVLMMISK